MNSEYRDKLGKEAQRIEEDSKYSSKDQYNSSSYWQKIHYGIGIPATFFAVCAGIITTQKVTPEGTAISILFSLLTALLTGLLTFLKPHEKASLHKTSGDKYLRLRNKARVFHEITIHDEDCVPKAIKTQLQEIIKEHDDLISYSPQPLDSAYMKTKKGIRNGEATHKVDRKYSKKP